MVLQLHRDCCSSPCASTRSVLRVCALCLFTCSLEPPPPPPPPPLSHAGANTRGRRSALREPQIVCSRAGAHPFGRALGWAANARPHDRPCNRAAAWVGGWRRNWRSPSTTKQMFAAAALKGRNQEYQVDMPACLIQVTKLKRLDFLGLVILELDTSPNFSVWCRAAHTIYLDKSGLSSGRLCNASHVPGRK